MSVRRAQPALIAAAMALFAASCAKASAPTQSHVTTSNRGLVTPGAGADAPTANHPRYGETTMYVDGEARAVLRFMELPPRLKPVDQPALAGSVERYLLADYLKAEGIDLARVRAVHVYGGQRVSPLTGDEVRAHAKELSFEFGGGDRGKPRIHYCGDIRPPARVDMISALAVYVDKEPPQFHPDARGGFLAFADGVPIEGIPYLPREQSKGTRVYVDGELAGVVKRKQLPDAILAGKEDGQRTFSLEAYLHSIGVDPAGARAIDLISGDDLVERLDSRQWDQAKKSFTFTIPAHSQGQIAVAVPAAEGERAKISAVQIFTKLAPPKRWIAPPEYVAMGGESRSHDPGQDMP